MGEDSPTTAATFDLSGTVQGVGFRPTLYRLATEATLGGWVQNRSGTVRLELRGPADRIERFMRELPGRLPPNAHLTEVKPGHRQAITRDEAAAPFRIINSHTDAPASVVIPPDLIMCRACREEIMTPAGRRYGYPFTTCTHCGPRYTVVNDMPYDRDTTTMVAFPLCDACRAEYEDPADRRFHAETIACPACGPTLRFLTIDGQPVDGDPLRRARRALADGAIVAVRGLGGFLLACDASNRQALFTLRERKNRPHKPFAVMAADLAVAERYCRLPPPARDLLLSPRGPILILETRAPNDDEDRGNLDLLTPDAATLGVMLPTTPLHHLLAHPLDGDPVRRFELLVMTSGNRGGEPICIANDDARERLGGIADFILDHDREINLRNDDSLCVIREDHPQVWRRARGFAPEAIALPAPLSHPVLAMGAELKNAIAMGFDRSVVMSPHVGDLETPEALDGLQQVVRCFPRFLQQAPACVAVDLHPDMHATRLGVQTAHDLGIPLVHVQHHHAHAAACLIEHGRRAGLALVFDGTGLGTDGSIWGAEVLDVTPDGARRLATFRPVALPGGDAAVTHPARQLVARWRDAGMDIADTWLSMQGITGSAAATWMLQCDRALNAPLTHAAGRLFDAFAVLTGVMRGPVTYEGQAAIRLEAAAARCREGGVPPLPYATEEADGLLTVDWRPAFQAFPAPPAAEDIPRHALAFHTAVARAATEMIRFALYKSESRVVALTGGVFMNRILTGLVSRALRDLGLEVLLHHKTPPNDGGIACGQAVIAGGLIGCKAPPGIDRSRFSDG